MLSFKINKKGFTLTELMVYIGLVVLIGAVLSTTVYYLGNADFVAFTYNETMQNGRNSMEIMTNYIHKADSVIIPATPGSNSNTLILSINSQNVTFSLSPDQRLQIQEGIGGPVNISSNKVIISNLNFRRVQNLGSKPTIKINMETRYIGIVIHGSDPTYNLTTTVGLR
jgi:Tfp pilus assembly protein PilW